MEKCYYLAHKLVVGRKEDQQRRNGLGIDMARHRKDMFGMYKTFHENAKGIVLFLVKSQLEALGGQIDVVSEVGKGTTFTIRFAI